MEGLRSDAESSDIIYTTIFGVATGLQFKTGTDNPLPCRAPRVQFYVKGFHEGNVTETPWFVVGGETEVWLVL